MSGKENPPAFVDPISQSLWKFLQSSGSNVSKLTDQVGKIKHDVKSVSDLNQTFTELNETLKDTNSILREFLNKL